MYKYTVSDSSEITQTFRRENSLQDLTHTHSDENEAANLFAMVKLTIDHYVVLC